MAELKEARVPDIGGYDDVPVIEVLVAVGDTVQGRPGPGHAGIGQGDDGSAGAVRRRGHAKSRSRSATRCPKAAWSRVIEPSDAGRCAAPPRRARVRRAARGRARSARGERIRAAETGTRVEPTVVDARRDNIAQASIEQKRASLAGAAGQRARRRSRSMPTR